MFNENEQFTEDKLLLLFALNELNMPITGLYITDLMLEPGYMNYFSIQLALNELIEKENVEATPDNDGIPMYTITDKGRETLSQFSHLIPKCLESQYSQHISSERSKIKKQLEVNALYFVDTENNYYVRCFVRDKGTYLIDLKLPASDKADAIEICKNWQNNSAAIYMKILNILH